MEHFREEIVDKSDALQRLHLQDNMQTKHFESNTTELKLKLDELRQENEQLKVSVLIYEVFEIIKNKTHFFQVFTSIMLLIIKKQIDK